MCKIRVFRIMPDNDLLEGVKEYCKKNQIQSGIVIGIIGSLKSAKLGFLKSLPANYITKDFSGPLEIVCAQGNISICDKEVVVHIHILVSNEDNAVGGHLVEANVFSTAEGVIQELDYQLKRKLDDYTGLNEIINY